MYLIYHHARITNENSVIAVTMWFVYILKCADNTFYTGCTSDLDDRMKRHSKGENTYTKVRLPVILVYYSAFQDKYKVLRGAYENRILKLSEVIEHTCFKLFSDELLNELKNQIQLSHKGVF